MQHPMATCWQLSIRSPVVLSRKELARPPSRGRLSSTVTAQPRGARAAAAASPASPPPTISTRGRAVAVAGSGIGVHSKCLSGKSVGHAASVPPRAAGSGRRAAGGVLERASMSAGPRPTVHAGSARLRETARRSTTSRTDSNPRRVRRSRQRDPGRRTATASRRLGRGEVWGGEEVRGRPAGPVRAAGLPAVRGRRGRRTAAADRPAAGAGRTSPRRRAGGAGRAGRRPGRTCPTRTTATTAGGRSRFRSRGSCRWACTRGRCGRRC